MKSLLTLLFLLFFGGESLVGQDKTGVLVLAHGGSESWNQMVRDAVAPLSHDYETAIAFGMANPYSMQTAINDLEQRGVKKIVAVQLFISSYSFIPPQNAYLLGLRDEMEQPPLVMNHGHGARGSSEGGAAHGHHNSDPWSDPMKSFPQLSIQSEVTLVEPLNDHPLVADILLENINTVSQDRENEILIIVGHGPVREDHNTQWVMKMESLAHQIDQKTSEDPFRMIYSITVRDDADEAIYNQAREHLRLLVRQSSSNGTVIVAPLLLSKGGIEKGILRRLDGLNYQWVDRTLLPNERITTFIEEAVAGAMQ